MNGPLSTYVEHLCRTAHRAWTEGWPRTEEPFMNQIVGEFHRSCPNNVQLYGLHRQRQDNADLHGADIAISVSKDNFQKLAVFQIKRILNGKVQLEHEQLSDGMQSGHPRAMFFILAVDPAAFDIRIDSVSSQWNNWPVDPGTKSPRKTKSVPAQNWMQLRPWVREWLLCNVGTITHVDFYNSQQAILTALQSRPGARIVARRPRWLPSALVKIALPDGYTDHDWS
jgi:hypothetical protein